MRAICPILLLFVMASAVRAQTITVLHNFTGGADGGIPESGLTVDPAGNLYGTTTAGGPYQSNCGGGCGTAFRLSNRGSSWLLTPLYDFAGGEDGQSPAARLAFGPDGSLYGTTLYGGGHTCSFGYQCGTVFNLKPPVGVCKTAVCPWTETVLYRFSGVSDGNKPTGQLVFDRTGTIYGTTANGGGSGYCSGSDGCGVAYQLKPSNGAWTQSLLHDFNGGADGAGPNGVVFGSDGALYGPAAIGGGYYGLIYKLTPSGSGWSKSPVYEFTGHDDGGSPVGGVIFDAAGNLYGTASMGGSGGGGTAFVLTPSDNSWTFGLLYSFMHSYPYQEGPTDSLVMDTAGNLYGTTLEDGAGLAGTVFKLAPSNGGWTYTLLYTFTDDANGGFPSGLVLDQQGKLYGTTQQGGLYGQGVVFEITP